MPDPFKLFGRLLLAIFKIAGYFAIFLVQLFLSLVSGKPDKIGDAFGFFGRGFVDAIADIFR